MTPAPDLPSEDTRSTILRAAMAEFAEFGEIGARTDAIARTAGVNKALLHYYFGTKKALYEAALDEILKGLKEHYLALLGGPGTPGQRMLRYVLASFDRMASSRDYARVLGHEMLRARSGESTSVPRMVQAYFSPLHHAVCHTLEEGIGTGEFQPMDSAQTALSITGANVFYFISAPVFREMTGHDPRQPDMLAQRRLGILDLAVSVLFADRKRGRKLAQAILCEIPATQVQP